MSSGMRSCWSDDIRCAPGDKRSGVDWRHDARSSGDGHARLVAVRQNGTHADVTRRLELLRVVRSQGHAEADVPGLLGPVVAGAPVVPDLAHGQIGVALGGLEGIALS